MEWWRLQLVTLAVVVVTATVSSAQQQQQAAVPAFPALPSCPPAPLSLSPCIGYIFGAGSATLNGCCSQLKSFLQAQAPCICAASKQLALSPVGMLLGQAQTIIPNVCDLPNPCDDAAAGEGSAPSEAGTTSPPSETTAPAAAMPATDEPATTAAAAAPDAPEEPTEDSPAPAGGFKLPQLLHAAGATSSRGMAPSTVFAAVFLASVAAIMYV